MTTAERRQLARAGRAQKRQEHPRPETAAEDMFVDVGQGSFVQVFKGDPIPARLAGLPRRPMKTPSPAGKGTRARR